MKHDRLTATVLFGVAVFAYTESGRYGPLSRLFPRIVAVALGLLAVVLLVQTFRHQKVSPQDGVAPAESRNDTRGMLLSLAVMVAWILLLEPVGFWISSVLCFALLAVVLRSPGKTVLWKNIVVGVALVTVFVLLFRITLRVPLPEGLLW